jgi:hypothetical protein
MTMAKGGARGRSGPPPDPDSLTQAEGEWTVLPAAGREGEVPAWPLAQAIERELDLWGDEWSRPQAIMWERQGQELEVALYVRSLVTAEAHNAPTNTRTLVKQLQEALGISMPGLLRNRWKIGAVEAPDQVDDGEEDVRLRLVAGDG